MMANTIEYSEVLDSNGQPKYYFHPIDQLAKHRLNIDNQARRIWKYNTLTRRWKLVMERLAKGEKLEPLTDRQLNLIQLAAEELPLDPDYITLQELKRMMDQHGRHSAKEPD